MIARRCQRQCVQDADGQLRSALATGPDKTEDGQIVFPYDAVQVALAIGRKGVLKLPVYVDRGRDDLLHSKHLSVDLRFDAGGAEAEHEVDLVCRITAEPQSGMIPLEARVCIGA